MTIRKRLARSHIAMLVIPILTAAVLALLGLGAALVAGLTLLRGSSALLTVDMARPGLLGVGYLFLSGAVAITAMVLPGISGSSVLLIAGVALSIKAIRAALRKHRSAMIWFILGLMLGSLYAIAMGPASLQTPQPPLSAATFRPLAFLLGVGLLVGLELLRRRMERGVTTA